MKIRRGAAMALVGLALTVAAVIPGLPALASGGSPVWPFSTFERLPDTLYQALEHKRVILLGEVHGTNEAPDTVFGLASLWRRHGRPVVVALEWPETLQREVNATLRTGDIDELGEHPFVRRKSQDGRTSTAMIELIGRLSKLGQVPVVCIDPDDADDAQDRDTGMAKLLARAVRQHPGATIVALMGNLHAKRQKVTEDDGILRPCGYELTVMPKGAVPEADVVSFNLEAPGGTAWVSRERRPGIQAMPLRRTKVAQLAGGQPYVGLFTGRQNGYDGRIFTRYWTASLPFFQPEPPQRRRASAIVPI